MRVIKYNSTKAKNAPRISKVSFFENYKSFNYIVDNFAIEQKPNQPTDCMKIITERIKNNGY